MTGPSKIEWTEATWNPIVGCSVVSPGCTNCYAMRLAPRLGANKRTPHYAGTTRPSRGGPVWTGHVAMASNEVLTAPLRRRKPTTWFVNSMGDLFHENVPDHWIDRVFAVMALAPRHTFQILTKRAARMREYMAGLADCLSRCEVDGEWFRRGFAVPVDGPPTWPLPNVWLGVSAEDQARAEERIPHLLATPAAIRFVSAEPLLGAVDLTLDGLSCLPCRHCSEGFPDSETGLVECGHCDCTGVGAELGIDWVICGGESGPKARPMHPDWARSLRDQCQAAGVAFFFKQWGEYEADQLGPEEARALHHPPGHVIFRKVGKVRAGRRLAAREWNQMPGVAR